jgi:putative ABC transport system permease protein
VEFLRLQNFAYRITISGWIFLLAGLIIVTISVLIISLRVIRAARANPVDSLRGSE